VSTKAKLQVEPQASVPLPAPLASIDADLLEAVEDVDPTLLAWSLSLSPLERLRAATRAASTLAKFRRVPTKAS